MSKQAEHREQLRQERIARAVGNALHGADDLHEQVRRIERHWRERTKRTNGKADVDEHE